MDAGALSAQDRDALLIELGGFAFRPRAFIQWAFPWGEPGELEKRKGPEPWQEELLIYLEEKLLAGLGRPEQIIGEAVQIAVRSGHNIGKSALVCWLILWALSTREDTKGAVTANTEKQLRLKLWKELAKWHRLFIAKPLFKWTASSIASTDPAHPDWSIDAIPWSEDNPEAFAGLHNEGKRALVIFDEASGITSNIWETIDGVMGEKDTELLWFAMGNPTRNTGRFRECFDAEGQGQFWKTFKVDSREVSFTNKEYIQKQIDLWGIESDHIKKRWLGEFPASSASQLISSEDIRAAMHREASSFYGEPLIMGVDVARQGDDESVIFFRRGKDARTIPMLRYRGLNNVELGNQVATLKGLHNPDAIFIDGGGVGSGVIDFLRHLGHSPIEVQFGGAASVPLGGDLAANKRAEMYLSLRTWLREGGCLPNDRDLLDQLIAVEFGHSKVKGKQDAIVLTPKDEMEDSPDIADAIALTFAFPVNTAAWKGKTQMKSEYDPLSFDRVSPAWTPQPAPNMDAYMSKPPNAMVN